MCWVDENINQFFLLNDRDISVDTFLSKSQIFSVLVSTSHYKHDYIMKWISIYVNLMTAIIAWDHKCWYDWPEEAGRIRLLLILQYICVQQTCFYPGYLFKNVFVICSFKDKFKEFTEASWLVNWMQVWTFNDVIQIEWNAILEISLLMLFVNFFFLFWGITSKYLNTLRALKQKHFSYSGLCRLEGLWFRLKAKLFFMT